MLVENLYLETRKIKQSNNQTMTISTDSRQVEKTT